LHSAGTTGLRSACAAQPGPARPRPAQRARPIAWPSSTGVSVRAAWARRGVARHACTVVVTSPAHERRPGKAWRGLIGAWTAAWHELVGVDDGVGWHNEAWTPASGGTAVRRRPTRTTVERLSVVGRRENAAARRTHRRTDGIGGGVDALGHARSGANSGGRRRAW
jgi:hypothetical protein